MWWNISVLPMGWKELLGGHTRNHDGGTTACRWCGMRSFRSTVSWPSCLGLETSVCLAAANTWVGIAICLWIIFTNTHQWGHQGDGDQSWGWVVNWPINQSWQDPSWWVVLCKDGDRSKKGMESVVQKSVLVCLTRWKACNEDGNYEWRKGMTRSIVMFLLSQWWQFAQTGTQLKQRCDEDLSPCRHMTVSFLIFWPTMT